MMKFLLLALAITAVSAQADETDIDTLLEGHEMIDALLEADMELPCTPKPCVPVCKAVTKYLTYGDFKIAYTENECAPDPKCLAAAATCVKKIQGLMVDADKKAKALEAASKKKNSAKATKAQKDKAAKTKKAEAAAAKKALSAAQAAFEVSEKEAAAAKSSMEKSKKSYAAKSKVMDKRLVSYENAKKKHLNAVAAYDGAKSAAALAASVYLASVKAHCDAEALHAEAVKKIGHGHHAKNTKGCEKYQAMTPVTVKTVKYSQVRRDAVIGKKWAGKLWSDRNQYRFIKAPKGVFAKGSVYFRPYLSSRKSACPKEGGNMLKFSAPATVHICCANHCRRGANVPSGGGKWKQLGGKYAIKGHGGAPCTFFEAKVSAGTHRICCGKCWGSGVIVKNVAK